MTAPERIWAVAYTCRECGWLLVIETVRSSLSVTHDAYCRRCGAEYRKEERPVPLPEDFAKVGEGATGVTIRNVQVLAGKPPWEVGEGETG